MEAPWQGISTGIPADAISDADLSRMRFECCDGPMELPYHGSQPWIEMPNVDPALSPQFNSEFWMLEVLPSDLMWHSYWAGTKEPRIGGTVFQEIAANLSLADVTLGGRAAVLRYGYVREGKPHGWELQVEGASMLRLNLDKKWDFESADFRFGVPLIYAEDTLQWKFAYYHLSSHVGDEFLLRNPTFQRINFSRDTLVAGVSYFPWPALRGYAEAGWAFYADEGSDAWEFQFGLDFSKSGPTGRAGTPFVAINAHLREEVDFGGNLVVQAGWLWRGPHGRIVRTGLHYFNGKSNQFEFFNNFEQQLGFGVWQEY